MARSSMVGLLLAALLCSAQVVDAVGGTPSWHPRNAKRTSGALVAGGEEDVEAEEAVAKVEGEDAHEEDAQLEEAAAEAEAEEEAAEEEATVAEEEVEEAAVEEEEAAEEAVVEEEVEEVAEEAAAEAEEEVEDRVADTRKLLQDDVEQMEAAVEAADAEAAEEAAEEAMEEAAIEQVDDNTRKATAEDTGEEPVGPTDPELESEIKAATEEKLREEEEENNLPHGTPSWHPARVHKKDEEGNDLPDEEEELGDQRAGDGGDGGGGGEEQPASEGDSISPEEEAGMDSAAQEVAVEAAADEVAAQSAAEDMAQEEAAEAAAEEEAAEEAVEEAAIEAAMEERKRRLSRRLLMDSPAGCPQDRFLLLGPRTYTGGFNNMMMTLENALHAARVTNRTLIVPPSRNERYNWLRFDIALDLDELRKYYPCFLGSNTEWGTLPAPTAPAAHHHRRLLGKGGSTSGVYKGGKIAAHKGYAPDDFIPQPGTYGSMQPLGATAKGHPTIGLTTAQLTGESHMGRPEARDYPVLRVGGNAWGGLMTMCPDHKLSSEFWEHVKPNKDVADEVARFREEKLGGADGKYISVHLRWLEGKCSGRADLYYAPSVRKQIGNMCTNKFKWTNGIVNAKGLGHIKTLFLASDRQRPDADKDFEKNGAVSYDKGNKKDKYYGDGTHFVIGRSGAKVFEPAVDMFLLAGAELFIGNMLSTFSTNVAAIRMAQGERESVLAWPEPQGITKTFWECERAHFWCGPDGDTFSSVGKTKAHGTC